MVEVALSLFQPCRDLDGDEPGPDREIVDHHAEDFESFPGCQGTEGHAFLTVLRVVAVILSLSGWSISLSST